MTPPWGINWQRYHADRQDMPHIQKMGYRSFTIYKGMWDNRDFVNELLSVARKDAIFLDRDHAKSEEKDDQWKNDPALKGRNHADDWAQKVKAGQVYTPLERTFFLGLNEMDSEHYQRQIDAYTEAYCRRMAEHGLRAAAYSFGVGHPSTVDLQPKNPPDWSWYAASAAAILEGHHLAAFHEYGAPTVGGYGWEYWCNRVSFCPYPFDAGFDECGIDNGVLQSGVLKGYAEFMDGPAYCRWLDGFQAGMAERAHTRKVNLLFYNIFGFDHGSSDAKDWHSFDIRPIRPWLEAFQWTVTAPTPQPAPVTPAKPPATGPTATPITPAGARIRIGPGVTFHILGAVATGVPIRVMGRNEAATWYRVESPFGVGWVSATVVSVKNVENVPVVDDDGPTPIEPPPTGNNWTRAIAFVLKQEGGLSTDKNDPGNYVNGVFVGTNFGISAAAYPGVDVVNLTVEQAKKIYEQSYWIPSGASQMPFPMCLAVLDLAVNGGVGRAKEASAAAGENFVKFMAWRIAWYTRLPQFNLYGAAWIRRCSELMMESTK